MYPAVFMGNGEVHNREHGRGFLGALEPTQGLKIAQDHCKQTQPSTYKEYYTIYSFLHFTV